MVTPARSRWTGAAIAALISILLLFVAIVFTVARPQFAIVFVLLLYPMEQVLQANIPQLGAAPWLINVIVGLLVVFAAFRAFLTTPIPLTGYFNPLMNTTIALYLFAFAGVLLSPSVDQGIEKLQSAAPYFTLLLVFPTLLVTRLEDWRKLIVPTLVSGSAVLILMLVSPRTYFVGARLVIDLEDVVGGAGNPLATAQLGGLLAIFGVLYRPDRGGQLLVLIRLAAIGLGLGVAALSGSRGQLLAAIGTIAVCFPLARQVRNPVQFFGTVFSAGLFLSVGFFVLRRVLSGRAGERWGAEQLQEGLTSRFSVAQQALTRWAENPSAWAAGRGTFSSGSTIAELEGTYVHNSVIQVITENGLIGFSLFSLALYLAFRGARYLILTHRSEPGLRSAAACVIAMALYEFVLSLKQGDYVANGAPFWAILLIGKLAGAEQKLGEYHNDAGDESWYEDDGYTENDEHDGSA